MMRPDARYGGLLGRSFGLLTFLGLAKAKGDGGRIIGTFLCVCGTQTERPVGRVIGGTIRHCGCGTDHGKHRTHGMRHSREYAAWVGMKNRCLNGNDKDYPRWGGRGIKVCPEWINSFAAFYKHVGARPPQSSLDRIDNERGYEPGNVRWASPAEQNVNRRDTWVVVLGERPYLSVAAAAVAHRVSETTIVRWCDGYVDRRRSPRRIPARPGCSRRRRYA